MLELSYVIIFAALLTVIVFILTTDIIVLLLLNGAFSLLTIVMYLILDAPDVAMTEATIGILVSIFAIYTIRKIYQQFSFADKFKPLLLIAILVLAGLLIYASTALPVFGQPAFNHYFLENVTKEIEIPSSVTAILASYRGYDTLLETLVILIGGIAVLLVSDQSAIKSASPDILVTKITRLISPMILLFALYIQFHGEVSPGGGFQAGALTAIAFILYAMSFGEHKLLELISVAKLKMIAVIGVMIYFLTGIVALSQGAEFLNYNIILGQKIGIMIVELGVGIAVASVILMIYLSLVYASHKSEL